MEEMTREFKKGEIVQLDADMANSGTVEVVRQTPLRKFTTVTDGRAQWDVMTYRLSPLPTEKAKELKEGEPCENCHCIGGHSIDCSLYAVSLPLEPLEACSKSLNEAVELIKSALSIKDLWCNYSEKAEHEGENIAISNMAKSFEAFLSQFKQ